MVGSFYHLPRQVKYSRVFKVNDAAVWPWFYLNVGNIAVNEFFCAEIVANGLLVNVQL